MAEVAARREARRKRILENSENRLRVISGLNKADDSKISSADTAETTYSPPSLKTDDHDPLPQSIPNNSQSELFKRSSLASLSHEPKQPSSPIDEKPAHGLRESSNDQFSPVPLQQKNALHFFILTAATTRMHLIGLAFLVRLLLSTSHGYWIGESVFVPLFTIYLIKYCGIFSRLDSDKNDLGLVNAILLLSGLPAQQIGRLLRIFGGLKGITEDLNVYFFSFIFFHVSLELITN